MEAPQHLVDLGNALYNDGDIDGAVRHYQSALSADPRCARAHYNLGVVMQRLGRADEAMGHYASVEPNASVFALARVNLSILQLLRHDFASGWEGYELRLATGGITVKDVPLPRLTMSTLGAARRVAIWSEQGVGDQILFSTLLPELVARGIEAVVETDPRLADAYRRSVAGIEFVTRADFARAAADCDHQSPIGSLPGLFRGSREDFARQPRALLTADPERLAATRDALGPGRRMAISWRSFQAGDREHVTRVRTSPLEALAALDDGRTRLVDVQYGDVGVERAAFDTRHSGLRLQVSALDLFNDLEGVLAAIEACDLVVTPSNVTAHLAGALGKRTLLVYLGPNPPFHYWAPGPDGRSLWYPSVEVANDRRWSRWEDAFEAVAARLRVSA